MANLGTGIQLMSVGPQNAYLDLKPEVTAFYRKTQKSTRFASEAVEDLPLQTVKFGKPVIFELPPRGDLLADMHVQVRVPAVQQLLGTDLPPLPVPVVVGEGAAVEGPPQLGATLITLEGFAGTSGTVWSVEGGKVWAYTAGGLRWTVVTHDSNLVHSTLVALAADDVRRYVTGELLAE